MPPLNSTPATRSCLTPYTAPPGAAAAQDATGPHHIGNAPSPQGIASAEPTLALSPLEAQVRTRILGTGAPERWALVKAMDRELAAAATQHDRDEVTRIMQEALAARGHDVSVLRDLGLNALDSVLNRAAWTTLLAALPSWASSAMTAGQLARGALTGSWSSLAAVLPSLAAALPTLRSHAEFDALVQSLPDTIRSGLHNLHEGITDADAQLRPNLAGGHLLPALAVAALLWQVQRSLPSPTRQLQGVARFIAELPNHWQRIAVVNGVGGALLSPDASPSTQVSDDIDAPKQRPGAQEKEQRIEFQRWFNNNQRPGPQRIRPVIDSIEAIPFDAAVAPGRAHAGGAVRDAPTVEAATSPATRQQGGWFSWLLASLPLMRGVQTGFQSVSQTPPPVEMMPMGNSLPSDAALGESALREVSATTPLVRSDVAASATAASQRFPNLRRAPITTAVIKVLGGAAAVTGAAYAASAAKQWLWPDTPTAATSTELAAQLAGEVVSLPNGSWGTGLDLMLGELDPAPRSGRVRRAAPEATTAATADAAADLTQLHGISAEQLDALRADPALLQQVQSLRRWSVAVARDIATHAGWEWVAQLPATEQELLVAQWQALRELRPALAAVEDSADAAMREALRKAGFSGDWQQIEVRLPSADVAGIQVDHRLPLLEYLLMRNALGTPSFLRGDLPVSAAELAQLTRFVGSADARRLQADINARVEQLRPDLGRALQARLVIDALKAKANGVLGSGNAHRRGADVVLGFLQGTGAVERATLTYTDRLPNGTPVTVPVPNYLVLRSAGEPGLDGQVVLYRSDLSSFQAFGDEGAFRQFLDTQRARSGMFAEDSGIDSALANDIVQATEPAQRTAVRGLVQSWEARFARYQSGDRSAKGWNPAESFQLDFTPVDAPEGARQQWADSLITHGQAMAQQRLDRNLLRWSPLGIANVAAENAYRLQQDTALQSLRQHAHGSVAEAMERALRMAGFQGSLEGFDPDRVRLNVGGHDMALTDWATSGWQRHGLRRPDMPGNLPDWSPDGAGMPNTRLEPAAWLDDATLDALQLVAYEGGAHGTPNADAALTAQLRDPALRRAICGELEDFADSNRLADAYIDHLRALPGSTAGRSFTDALANQLRARTGWMIETARQDGTLDATTHAALKAAHAQLEPDGARPSSLQAITLNGHTLVGLWAIRSAAGRHVFLPDTAHGDQLLGERAFADWLRQPEAEGYIRQHAQFRHHPDLAALFAHTSSSRAMPVGYAATRGPQAAAAAVIAARIDDVDEMTVSQLERFAETLSVIGGFSLGALCALASGPAGAAFCIAGTLGLVGQSVRNSVDQFERGDRNGGILSLAEGLFETFDLLDVSKLATMTALMFRLGKPGLRSPTEAMEALLQARGQLRAFAADGSISAALALPRTTLDSAPMLSRRVPGGGTLYLQRGREYLQRHGDYVETYLDGDGVRRLRDPHGGDAAGAPVHFKEGEWRRMDSRPTGRGGTTPLPEATLPDWVNSIPEAGALPPASLDELEAIFGVRTLATHPTADVMNVISDWTMTQRIQEVIATPETLGRPGEAPIVMRAWADSPRLGNGRSVETFFHDMGEWTRGARFGTGPVGLHVGVGDARTLPSVEALVDAAGLASVSDKLGLPAQTPRSDVLLAVRRELAQVIGTKPEQSQLTWQRWRAMQHRLPTAADNLVKHYPELTRAEAQELTASDEWLARDAESWLFPKETAAQVANVLANRKQREQRQSVVRGRVRNLSEAQVLLGHLQEVLPARTWGIRSAPTGSGTVLTFSESRSGAAAGQVTFANEGAATVPTDVSPSLTGWQQRVFDQLAEAERQSVGDPEQLRRAVMERMKQSKGAAECAVPRRSGGRMARSADACSPITRATLDPADVQVRDVLDEDLIQLRATMEAKHTERSVLEREYNALWAKLEALKKQKLPVDPADSKRLTELGRNDFGLLKGFDVMNFANYRLSDLAYKGEPVDLGASFASSGAAASGDPRSWMGTEGFVEPNYIRRVLVPNAIADGKLTQTGMFPEDYAMGADLSPVVGRMAAPGQPSVEILLTEDDLMVHAPGTKGRVRNVRFDDLSDADIERLGPNDVSATMKKVLGDAKLLPSNARKLEAGESYRVYLVRSCSEDKIINNLFSALGAAVPEIAQPLKGSSRAPLNDLSGDFSMLTEMHPCETSCNIRLKATQEFFNKMKFYVFYRFDDNKQRREWWAEKRVDRLVRRGEEEWATKGYTNAQMRTEATEQLKDPQALEWVNADMLRDPPTQPKPRLWDPSEEQAF